MWYGLFKGDRELDDYELVSVQYFGDRCPTTFDFNEPLFSWNDYIIREVDITW